MPSAHCVLGAVPARPGQGLRLGEQPGRPWGGAGSPQPCSPRSPCSPTRDRGPPERHIPARCKRDPTRSAQAGLRGPPPARPPSTANPGRASSTSSFVTREISRNVRLRAKTSVGGGVPWGCWCGARPFVWEQVTAEDPALPRSPVSPPTPATSPGPPTPAGGAGSRGPGGRLLLSHSLWTSTVT